MNKDRLTETATLLGEIQTLVYLLNNSTDYAVFCDFQGHVNGLTVTIAKSKERYGECIARLETYVPPKKWGNENQMMKRLHKIKAELEKLLAESGVKGA